MKETITRILDYSDRRRKKTIDTAWLLREAELQMGSETFELRGGYIQFHFVMEKMRQQESIIPVKASGRNGRNPALYNKYRMSVTDGKTTGTDNNAVNEILAFHPVIKKDFYLKNINQYIKDREIIHKLSNYLYNLAETHALSYRCTLNERSFEIFGDEKLLGGAGEAVLKRSGLDFKYLNCYRTYEAFFYYYLSKTEINNVLVIENKDTFLSLIKACNADKACCRHINLLIYGEGNKIQNSFKFMEELESAKQTGTVYYFGDLDYPGIDIFQRFKTNYPGYRIIPHVGLYKQLIESVKEPPCARNEKINDISEFLSFFDNEYASRMDRLLTDRKYIPQEAINFARKQFRL